MTNEEVMTEQWVLRWLLMLEEASEFPEIWE
jgi:hypothetical protein